MLTFLLLLLTGPSFAATPALPKSRFLEQFPKEFSRLVCGEKSMFRKCFSTSADACRSGIAAALASCISELEKSIPAELKQPDDGARWGQQIGSCAGQKFEAANAKQAVRSKECEDPSKWTQPPPDDKSK